MSTISQAEIELECLQIALGKKPAQAPLIKIMTLPDRIEVRDVAGIYISKGSNPFPEELVRRYNAYDELVAALNDFVRTCDFAPPVELMGLLSKSCEHARETLAKHAP